jgi:hypothetical protein
VAEYTEGVAAQGPVILKDGVAMSFDAIMVDLKSNSAMTQVILEAYSRWLAAAEFDHVKEMRCIFDKLAMLHSDRASSVRRELLSDQ